MYTFCYFLDGLPPYLYPDIPVEIVDINWKICRKLARIKNNTYSEWAIRRNSDKVIIAQSRGYKA